MLHICNNKKEQLCKCYCQYFRLQQKCSVILGAFFKKDDMVYYLHYGMPVYTHNKEDLNNFRFITANLIHVHACSPSQLSKVFGVNKINFERYVKRLKEGGTDAFFNAEDNRGKCYKMLEDKLKKAQELLDKGYSQLKTAKEIGVSESAIRYHLRAGNLKKSNNIK